MPKITRYGYDRHSNLRVAPATLTPAVVVRLIAFMDGPPSRDPGDVPALLRPDCTVEEPISIITDYMDLPAAVVIETAQPAPFDNGLRPSLVIIDEAAGFTEYPRGASGTAREAPSAVSSGTASTTMAMVERHTVRAPFAEGLENGHDTHSPARPAANSDRMAMIRAAGQRLQSRNGTAPRPSLAPVTKAESQISGKPDWIGQRHALLAGAIAFLKVKAILVTPVDKDALVRQYFVSGKRDRKLAEDVIAIAEGMGWEARP